MFDDLKLMHSSVLGKVWQVGNRRTTAGAEEVSLPRICTSLNRYLDGMEAWRQAGKVPLKTSSELIYGAAKLYEAEVNNLIRECYELDTKIALKKTRTLKWDIGNQEGSCLNVSLQSSSNQDSNERTNDSSVSKRKRQSTPNHSHREKRSCSAPLTDSSGEVKMKNENEKTDGDDFNLCDNGICEIRNELCVPMLQDNEQTHDQGVQTNQSYLNDLQQNKNKHNGSNDLSFGFVMLFENNNDWLPRKILFSSFKSGENNL